MLGMGGFQKPSGMKNTGYLLVSAVVFGLAFEAAAATRFVDLINPSPVSPYTSWATAATNIQQAVDVASDGDLVLVTNGVFQVGGRLVGGVGGDTTTNRLVVIKPVTVQSVNGPAVSVIKGYQLPGTTNGVGAVRCAYLGANARLIGFTLTGGATETNSASNQGGGVKCGPTSVVSNCLFTGNSAIYGGGVYSGVDVYSAGTNFSCVFSNNVAQDRGGGGFAGTYVNCLFVGNTATSGGAVSTQLSGKVALHHCTVYGNSASFRGGGVAEMGAAGGGYIYASNCIIVGNVAPTGPNYFSGASLFAFCCTSPVPASGIGNFNSNPQFSNPLAGDFHLQPSSPCINGGGSAYVAIISDLDGSTRVVGGTVDIGAYEFQSPSSVLSYAWAQRYGLPTNGSADFADPDADGVNNYGEWRSDTIPTNAISVLRMVSATNIPAGANVTWQSVATRSYWLERATSLSLPTPFQPVATNIAGVVGTKTFTDTSATNGGPYFYRVGVQ